MVVCERDNRKRRRRKRRKKKEERRIQARVGREMRLASMIPARKDREIHINGMGRILH